MWADTMDMDESDPFTNSNAPHSDDGVPNLCKPSPDMLQCLELLR